MDKKPERLVPEVRFKGFTDDWEQRKFDNVVKRINDKDDNPELPHIEFENIISGNGTLNKNIKNLNSKKIGTKFQKEDILFGKLRPYLKNWYFAKENGIAVGDFWVLRAKKISVFVYYLIQTEKFYSIANLSSGSKMPRSDWNLVSNSRFNFPENTIESIKIGNLILQFDKLITLQQRKLEILIKLKQSFLTKSMVNNLDKNPELYFNSASIKWLKQKLSNLTIKEFKGNTKLNDTKPGKTEYLDAERLNGNAPLFIDKPINTLKSDILILWDGSKAGSVYYGFEGSLGSTLKAIRLNPKLVNSFFVYQQLKSKQDVIFNKYRTPNIPHVIKNFTKVYSIYFPSMAVQNKIARFLGNLDTLIE
ncbi:restriction endonuclease subunit S, partial [Limosilactobacillus reuteri]|uniref:restriction endonuclease subunit S n=1 Tax=Limosilactobacillus reuteri TaxID=1598 RepID=UPI0010942C27